MINKNIKTKKQKKTSQSEIGLYFHVPFCKSRCKYCSFNSSIYDEKLEDKYFNAMLKEIDKEKKRISESEIKTIYFGGGTPSIVKPENIKMIFNKIKELNGLSSLEEATIEVNPCSAEEEKIKAYKKIGFNRISIGLQSANNEILSSINRSHTKDDFIKAMDIIVKYFDNFSVDIMIGLPGQKMKDLKETIKLALSYKPNHISAYGLMLEEGTPLFKEYKQGKLNLPVEDESLKMHKVLNRILNKRKLKRYEISNYAKKGFESKHNLNYWRAGNFLGFGAGAYSEFDSESIASNSDVKEYASLKFNRKAEHKTAENIRVEKIMLGLRLKEGIPLNLIYSDKKETIKSYEKLGYLKISGTRLKPTAKGYEVLNQIIVNLI